MGILPACNQDGPNEFPNGPESLHRGSILANEVCVISSDASMTIKVFYTSTEMEAYTVAGIDTTALVTIRDIVGLVLEVKGEMRLRRLASDRQQRGCKG